MSAETFDLDKVKKSLAALQDIAKGHASGGTSSTKVESMTGQGGPTQIYHTPANSDPGSWAGSTARDVADNGATDDIAANGTDYGGNGNMVKAIMDKIAKGQPVTAAEYKVLEKGMMPFGKDKKDKDDDDDADDVEKGFEDKDKDEDKTITKSISEDDDLAKGFDVVPFLEQWSAQVTKAIDARLDAMSKSITKHINTRISAQQADSGAITKSLADAMAGVGATVVATHERLESLESTPARGARSVAGVQAIQKGSYAGAEDDYISKALNGDPMAKAEVADALADMVTKGLCSPQEAILFDSVGQISTGLLNKVRSFNRG